MSSRSLCMGHSGDLIVIEGIDGAGKTTICEELASEHSYHQMTQPEDSWIGNVARRALNEDVEPECDLFLHMAAHANQQKKLKSKLECGDVVMDRYYHSRVAYQAVQTRFSPKRIEEMHLEWSVEPSKTIVLDLPAEVALIRKKGGEDKFENIEFLSKVRDVYKSVFEGRKNTTFIDGSKSKERVLQEVERVVR